MDPVKPGRAPIMAFLQTVLADGAVPVRDLETCARAEGLLAERQPISQCKPFRSTADKLRVLRFREDDRWFWQLPPASDRDDRKMPDAPPQRPTDSDTLAPQYDIGAAADTLASGGGVVSPDSPSTPVRDLAAERREFMEKMLRLHQTPEAHEAMRQGREQAEKVIRAEYERLGLTDVFPTRH